MPEFILDTVVLRVMSFAHRDGLDILLQALGTQVTRCLAEVYNRDEDAVPLGARTTLSANWHAACVMPAGSSSRRDLLSSAAVDGSGMRLRSLELEPVEVSLSIRLGSGPLIYREDLRALRQSSRLAE